MDMDPGDIGTRFDDPADIDALSAGQPATLFALLKLICLLLADLTDAGPANPN